ncbi:hypothetical protein SAMN05443246_4566 [Paenibacillus sp. GP183]|nr:hypothetical protein SAMN05443246_4566 [Paenibacillus sp. GP183]
MSIAEKTPLTMVEGTKALRLYSGVNHLSY